MAKKQSPVPDQGWAVKGLTYPQTKGNNNAKVDISIPEQGCCISMPGVNGAFGTPIDAELAIDSMRRFQLHFHLYSDSGGHGFEESLNNMEKKELVKLILKARNFHNKLIPLNYGMTMDKNMALKLLSQPGCEGIRFYLCSKKKDDISLVSVGVNCEGFDLNYKSPDTITYAEDGVKNVFLPKKGDTPAILSVKTESLIGDYVTPPNGIELEDLSLDISNEDNGDLNKKQELQDYRDCFVLLNIATKNKTTF